MSSLRKWGEQVDDSLNGINLSLGDLRISYNFISFHDSWKIGWTDFFPMGHGCLVGSVFEGRYFVRPQVFQMSKWRVSIFLNNFLYWQSWSCRRKLNVFKVVHFLGILSLYEPRVKNTGKLISLELNVTG